MGERPRTSSPSRRTLPLVGALAAGTIAGVDLDPTIHAPIAVDPPSSPTDLTADESKPKVVGLMYVMLLVGSFASALAFGAVQLLRACRAEAA